MIIGSLRPLGSLRRHGGKHISQRRRRSLEDRSLRLRLLHVLKAFLLLHLSQSSADLLLGLSEFQLHLS